MGEQYLIWSNEHRSWWRTNSLGYTTNVAEAGIYPRAQALEICERATMDWSRAPNEVPVRLEDLPEEAQAMVRGNA